MTLPAGLLPSDLNIEIFADPDNFGKCYFIQYGKTKPFHELPIELIPDLYKDCYLDRKAVAALRNMGVNEDDIVEHYNFCNRGKLDSIPDIAFSGELTREYFDCGRRGHCIGEGKCCKAIAGNVKLTNRETECLKLNAKGKNYSQIATEMGFRNQLPVNSIMARLRDKLGAESKSDLIIKSIQFGIV